MGAAQRRRRGAGDRPRRRRSALACAARARCAGWTTARAAPGLVDGAGALGARRRLGAARRRRRLAAGAAAGAPRRRLVAARGPPGSRWSMPRRGGLNFILSVFCLVWAADIVAYFGGRAFGQRKLAPAISPGKSWEGVWSGMVGALARRRRLAGVRRLAAGRLRQPLHAGRRARCGSSAWRCVVVFLVAMSVVGDLFESLVKRSAGAKDSSGAAARPRRRARPHRRAAAGVPDRAARSRRRS